MKENKSMPTGCIASNKVMVDGKPVGYMYREEPVTHWPDSGWRFFAGDEDGEYIKNPDNFKIYDIETLKKHDPQIAPYLNANYPAAFDRDGDKFKESFIDEEGK